MAEEISTTLPMPFLSPIYFFSFQDINETGINIIKPKNKYNRLPNIFNK